MIFYIVIALAVIRQLVGLPDSLYIPILDLCFLGPATVVLLHNIATGNTRISLWALTVVIYLLTHAVSLFAFGIIRNVLTYPVQEIRFILYFCLIATTYRSVHLLSRWYMPKNYTHLILSIVVVYCCWYIFRNTYRPAIMSESNYDATLIVGYSLLSLISLTVQNAHDVQKNSSILLLMMSIISSSRTAMLTALLAMSRSKKLVYLLFNLTLIITFLLAIYAIDFRGIQTFGLKSIDRILFLQTFWQITRDQLSFNQILLGWNFFDYGNCYQNDALNWYLRSQSASNELKCLVPANLHGLIPRLVAQYGILGFIMLYLVPLVKIVRLNYTIVTVYFLIGGLSQSFYYHAYAAGILLIGIFTIAKNKF